MRQGVRQAGQRLIVGFHGHEASGDVKRMIRDYGAGTVILFARNVASPEQVAELVRELQGVARDARHELPLFIAVDQEGGRVARMRAPWTEWPPMRALGRQGSEDVARKVGEALAAELFACGIRLDFAPVMDVDTNPKNPVIGDRSFGADPDLVGRLGVAMIDGLQGGGVAASAKHFPGHGDTDVDSHLDMPSVEHSRSRLEDVELRPFRRAIEAGVATVMTGHVLVRALDEELPGTLSPRVVGGLLRGELGYKGVIVSDDLEMKAVAGRWPRGEAAALAARAGCDLLSVCASHDRQVEALEAIVKALETEAISWSDMDDACLRIRRLKEKYLVPWQDPDPRAARAAAGAGERQALAREVAEYSA